MAVVTGRQFALSTLWATIPFKNANSIVRNKAMPREIPIKLVYPTHHFTTFLYEEFKQNQTRERPIYKFQQTQNRKGEERKKRKKKKKKVKKNLMESMTPY